MDAFVTVIKASKPRVKDVQQPSDTFLSSPAPTASGSRATTTKGKQRARYTYDPIYPSPTKTMGKSTRAVAVKETTTLLKSLDKTWNPISHDTGKGYDYVSSCCTGHERRDGGGSGGSHSGDWMVTRNTKLRDQEKDRGLEGKSVLRGVRAYLGFCETNTDIELRRIIVQAGGSTTYNQTSATHIVTSQWLSGSKTHKLLTTRTKNKYHVVSPDWVMDSIARGKRQNEWKYSKVESSVQRSIKEAFGK